MGVITAWKKEPKIICSRWDGECWTLPIFDWVRFYEDSLVVFVCDGCGKIIRISFAVGEAKGSIWETIRLLAKDLRWTYVYDKNKKSRKHNIGRRYLDKHVLNCEECSTTGE